MCVCFQRTLYKAVETHYGIADHRMKVCICICLANSWVHHRTLYLYFAICLFGKQQNCGMGGGMRPGTAPWECSERRIQKSTNTERKVILKEFPMRICRCISTVLDYPLTFLSSVCILMVAMVHDLSPCFQRDLRGRILLIAPNPLIGFARIL